MTGNILTAIIALTGLIIMSAYFSATETAFSSLNKTRLKTLAEKGNKRAQLACRLSEDYDKLISSILIGNNIVNISAASIGTVLFVRLYGNIGATISTVVITVVVLIFGEISPKSLAKDAPERFALFSAPIIRILIWILTPINAVFSLWKRLLSRLFRLNPDTKMSQEELLMLVEEVSKDGSIDEEEGELLKNAIEFTERSAEDILTHRTDIEAVSADASKEEIAEMFSKTKYSRLLVYRDTIDDIAGVIHQKNFYTGSGITTLGVKDIITPVLFVLNTEKINSLLQKLQKSKTHVAVVLDEYGGTCGIVTMEDILEELVGEIWDEHDEITESFKKLSENLYCVDASIDLDDFCEFFDVKIESESASLVGWAADMLGEIPKAGDSFSYENLDIKVRKTESHRIEEIEVNVNEPVAAEE